MKQFKLWAGRIWASPLTLLGFILALLFIPRFFRLRGGAIHVGVRWVWPWWLDVIAQCHGDIIITMPEADRDPEVWEHEKIHSNQGHALGILSWIVYPILVLATWLQPGARYYLDHPLECQAQKLGRRARQRSKGDG